MQSNPSGEQQAHETPIAAVALRGGGTANLFGDRLALPDRMIPLNQITWAGMVVDTGVPVPAGALPAPAIGLRLADGQTSQLAIADPPDAWRLLEALYRQRPDLRMPLPALPASRPYVPSGAPYPPVAPSAPYAGAPLTQNDTILAGLSHLSIFFAPILLPLIVWLVTRQSSPYASRQAKQAFFFHIIYTVAAIVLYVVALAGVFGSIFSAATDSSGTLTAIPFILIFVLYGVLLLLMLIEMGFSIYGAVQAFQGRPFSYPFLGRL